MALYASNLLALVGLAVYVLGLSLADPSAKRQSFFPRHFCAALIAAELLFAVWYALPRSAWPQVLLVYLLHLSVLVAVSWLLVQVFVLAYTILKLFNAEGVREDRGVHYLIGYGEFWARHEHVFLDKVED